MNSVNMQKSKTYFDLTIIAADPKTDIWVGDDEEVSGLVQKETGEMKASLLMGHYKVRFGLTGKDYDFYLDRPLVLNEGDLIAGQES